MQLIHVEWTGGKQELLERDHPLKEVIYYLMTINYTFQNIYVPALWTADKSIPFQRKQNIATLTL